MPDGLLKKQWIFMIEIIFVLSFLTIGYCCTFWDGMIFEKIAVWLESKLPEWIRMPLYECIICACFWWGSLFYWIFWGNSWKEWFICTVSAMGLNAVISRLIARLEVEKNE